MNMKLQVKQWGNSAAIRLPKDFTHAMNLNMGDFLELEKVADNKITLVIVPNRPQPRKRLTLAERIARTSVDKLNVDEEWDSLQPVGKEV
ncbi:MAG: antitoxin MazE [Pasteurellaceae bacterium]|nr:antitoxin MazE [Pasteurellaceae bacterium]